MAQHQSWARVEPFLRYKTVTSGTFVSGNSVVVADTEVAGNSVILVIPTSIPAGTWYIVSQTAGTGFTVGSTDAESNVTFNYIIL